MNTLFKALKIINEGEKRLLQALWKEPHQERFFTKLKSEVCSDSTLQERFFAKLKGEVSGDATPLPKPHRSGSEERE